MNSFDPSETAKSMMENEWRNGSWGELVRVPVENVHPLDETRLLAGGLGYGIDDLGFLSALMVTFGGLRDVDVRPGETVLVAPATGYFGGAAVHVALALGANVVAMGRNETILGELKSLAEKAYPGSRLAVVKMEADLAANQAAIEAAATSVGSSTGNVDVYFDISPPNLSSSSHIKAGVLSLRPGGRMSLMGGAARDVAFPYVQIMLRNLRLQGTFMYTPQQVDELIKLVESGRLKLGKDAAGIECAGVFELQDWENAFRVAAQEGRAGRYVLLAPNGRDAS
jgi:D-arabinose 1-dehydrogenase-like Zn-dependent alcohol dehydrogenase